MSLDDVLKKHKDSIDRRTWCKYGDCILEKLENEFIELKRIWTELEENWSDPIDYEDLYRVYPLLDTTAALTRKRLSYVKERWSKYKIEIIKPATLEEIASMEQIDTSEYFYSDEDDFYYGKREIKQLGLVVSTFLHADRYTYKDTRKDFEGKLDFNIYLKISTDKRSEFINIKDYVLALEKFIQDEIDLKMGRRNNQV